MKLINLKIENFRSIQAIEIEMTGKVCVIIGPNAIGKTTILDAIRLAKAVLSPRTAAETTQVLQSLSAVSPYMPQSLSANAIANDPNQPIKISTTYEISANEYEVLVSQKSQISIDLALQTVGLVFPGREQIVAFMNSPQGHFALTESQLNFDKTLTTLKNDRTLRLILEIDPKTSTLKGKFPVEQKMFSILDNHSGPYSSLFSYFPADRALPSGEQQIQIGMADAGQQIESYNSQPQLKYSRLKNTIFNAVIGGDNSRKQLTDNFDTVFNKVLRGKKLGNIGVNSFGMLSIPIVDKELEREFQIDGLSSGEKGLLLTCLLISQNVANGGIILLDEPELHLNPAVCRDLLQFFVDEYAEKRNNQLIICSHSAEILAGTFDRPTCELFHLRGPTTLAKVRYSDRGEIRDLLRRLGSSESEALLYRGTVSVEGPSDVEILQHGFDDLLNRHRVKARGGRSQIEVDIKDLQKTEKKGEEIGYYYFIFDLDRKPTTLTNSKCVRFLQLDRYCIENYLLDAEILTDLSRDKEFADKPASTVDSMSKTMKAFAMAQLDELAARNVFKSLELEKVGFDFSVFKDAEIKPIVKSINKQIQDIKNLLKKVGTSNFESSFSTRFEEEKNNLQTEWKIKWLELCDGKRLFADLRKAGHFKGDLQKLQKRVVERMRVKETPEYKALHSKLKSLISS